ncbi:hypothetical protein P152DRAFT_376403, partial [Eremomyces bilateralis CBS 781.70]
SGGFANPFDSSSKSTFSSSSISYLAEAPDLSRISDPNVVVLLKNLSKREDITRSKALQDLADYVSQNNPGEDGALLDAWVSLYPRLSIDNARKVRQLAHTILGILGKAAGKRLAKHLSRLIGPWMASCNEADDAVARAAQESVSAVFDSDEKRQNLKIAFQGQIIDFCYDAIARESPKTLSDERYVNEEDSKAKYARVASAALKQLSALLRDLDTKTLSTHADKWGKVVGDLRVWELGLYSDPPVRQSTHTLLQLFLTKTPDLVDASPDSICRIYLGSGLKSDQTRSSTAFLDALCLLTREFTYFWTKYYRAKKSPKSSLLHLIQRGAQRGGPRYWKSLHKLLNELPPEVLPKDPETTIELLDALRSAATSKEESRGLHQDTDTLEAYVLLCQDLIQGLPEPCVPLAIEQYLCPLVSNCVLENGKNMGWSLAERGGAGVIESVLRTPGMHLVIGNQWSKISDDFVATMEKATPVAQNEPKPDAEARNSSKIQESLQVQGRRWASVYRLAQRIENEEVRESLKRSLDLVASRAIEFLTLGKGENYGTVTIRELVLAFLEGDLPGLLLTPSGPILASILYAVRGDPSFTNLWNDTVAAIFALGAPSKTAALKSLLFPSKEVKQSELIQEDESIQSFFLEVAEKESTAESSRWQLLVGAAKHPSRLSDTTITKIIRSLGGLRDEAIPLAEVWKLADFLEHGGNDMLLPFLKSSEGVHWYSKILCSKDLSSSLPENFADDFHLIEDKCITTFQKLSIEDRSALGSSVIQQNLITADEGSPSIEALLWFAHQFFKYDTVESREPAGLFPDRAQWTDALNTRFLGVRPSPLTSMSNPLGGAAYLVDTGEEYKPSSAAPQVDSREYSIPLRMAMYYGAAMRFPGALDCLPREHHVDLAELFLLSLRLANDNFDIPHCNGFWVQHDYTERKEIGSFLDGGKRLIEDWIKKDDSFIYSVMRRLKNHMAGVTTRSFYNAVSYVEIMEEAASTYGQPQSAVFEEEQLEAWANPLASPISTAATLKSLRGLLSKHTKSADRFNRLCAEVTGYNVDRFKKDGLSALVVINAALSVCPELADTIAKQRLIFLVQRLIKALEDHSDQDEIQSEVLQTLRVLLPTMIETYGSYWSVILDLVADIWSTTTADMCTGPRSLRITLLHTSLKLYATLRNEAKKENANEDLGEALGSSTQNVADSLVHLARVMAEIHDHPPILLKENVNELLMRTLKQIPLTHFPPPSELFGFLNANSAAIQKDMYEILHGLVEEAQKEISVEAALGDATVELPSILIDMVKESPGEYEVDQPLTVNWQSTSPLPVRGYLFAWLLVFAHFQAPSTSFKVKAEYAQQLASTTAVKSFLDYVVDALGHAVGRPKDVSKFDLVNGEVDGSEDEVKQKRQRLAHLYFLCLRHLPNKVREWWFTCPRHVSKSVEEWTERYFSPLVSDTALKVVREWVDTMKQDDANEALSVKTSPASKQAVAIYQLDDETAASIVISLPPSYPLRPADALTDKRVGVTDRKWQTWLLVTKGVMTFSNGSIVEGIIAWRKNINGSLKGQTECSICQSLISEDNQFPSKKCVTCKNMFHASCLHKWFQSSNSSTCPLCRQQFNY